MQSPLAGHQSLANDSSLVFLFQQLPQQIYSWGCQWFIQLTKGIAAAYSNEGEETHSSSFHLF